MTPERIGALFALIPFLAVYVGAGLLGYWLVIQFARS